MAPGALARRLEAVFQAQGPALGVAEEVANMVLFAQASGEPALAAVLRGDTAGLLEAPAALDAACAEALGARPGMGTAGSRGRGGAPPVCARAPLPAAPGPHGPPPGPERRP